VVHECRFEEYAGKGDFDLCLFSESFQYIPLDQGLARCLALLRPEGVVIIADCFRTDAYQGRQKHGPQPGGGHKLTAFRRTLAELPFDVRHEEDITASVAPSIDLEQRLFHVFGFALQRIDAELQAKRPRSRWVLMRLISLFVSARRRAAIWQRLTGTTRSAEVFCHYNRYVMMVLARR
jgi:MPBQ/MSBQ methyltransferase